MNRDEMEGGGVLLSHPVLNYTMAMEKNFRLQRIKRTGVQGRNSGLTPACLTSCIHHSPEQSIHLPSSPIAD